MENNIIVNDKEYAGTPGLIVATTPDDSLFTNGDYDNYAEIIHSANALSRNTMRKIKLIRKLTKAGNGSTY